MHILMEGPSLGLRGLGKFFRAGFLGKRAQQSQHSHSLETLAHVAHIHAPQRAALENEVHIHFQLFCVRASEKRTT
jgi:hypothetical protein